MSKTAAELVGEARSQIADVPPSDAAAELAAGTAVALDVREPVEWEHHIEGAIQVPRGLLEFATDPTSPRHNEQLNPNNRVIVYCRSGVRAVLAAQTLKTLGYTDVANLEGGITAWVKAGLPTVEHHGDI